MKPTPAGLKEDKEVRLNPLAVRFLASEYVVDAAGGKMPLHSHTSLEQAEFLVRQIRALDAAITLEIGLAYGISALCIAEAIKHMPHARHIVIDPYQNTPAWQGLGLKNLERAGLRSIVDFREGFAQMVLPQLLQDGVRIDFAYVDAGKRMDDTLIFSHFLQQLVRVGGLIAFDDLSFPGVRKALRYILRQNHFRIHESFGIRPDSKLRRLISSLARRTPGGTRLFAPELLLTDSALGLDASCVVIEKLSEPRNDWSWHPLF